MIAHEIGEMNEIFIKENKSYLLMGFGRWGTSDPWLGIPVEWYQISRAQVVVESNLEDFNIDPSLGSHFFHNLTSLGMGYIYIPKTTEREFINWDWIKSIQPYKKMKYVKHIRFAAPLEVRINAHESKGVIFKPAKILT